jgi:serine/threonine protein kinase
METTTLCLDMMVDQDIDSPVQTTKDVTKNDSMQDFKPIFQQQTIESLGVERYITDKPTIQRCVYLKKSTRHDGHLEKNVLKRSLKTKENRYHILCESQALDAVKDFHFIAKLLGKDHCLICHKIIIDNVVYIDDDLHAIHLECACCFLCKEQLGSKDKLVKFAMCLSDVGKNYCLKCYETIPGHSRFSFVRNKIVGDFATAAILVEENVPNATQLFEYIEGKNLEELYPFYPYLRHCVATSEDHIKRLYSPNKVLSSHTFEFGQDVLKVETISSPELKQLHQDPSIDSVPLHLYKVWMASSILEKLGLLWTRNFYHGDIKPENIVIGPKVQSPNDIGTKPSIDILDTFFIDTEFSQLMVDDDTKVRSSPCCGSVLYMDPSFMKKGRRSLNVSYTKITCMRNDLWGIITSINYIFGLKIPYFQVDNEANLIADSRSSYFYYMDSVGGSRSHDFEVNTRFATIDHVLKVCMNAILATEHLVHREECIKQLEHIQVYLGAFLLYRLNDLVRIINTVD